MRQAIAVASYLPPLILLFAPYIGLVPKPGMRWVEITLGILLVVLVVIAQRNAKVWKRR